jgi:hypothetical protein
MKLKYNFIINQVADNMVAVPVGNDLAGFSGFLKINEIGAEILEILKEEATVEEVAAKMLEKHPESNMEEALETVKEFTDKLLESGIVE